MELINDGIYSDSFSVIVEQSGAISIVLDIMAQIPKNGAVFFELPPYKRITWPQYSHVMVSMPRNTTVVMLLPHEGH
jgi:hypothetical protein